MEEEKAVAPESGPGKEETEGSKTPSSPETCRKLTPAQLRRLELAKKILRSDTPMEKEMLKSMVTLRKPQNVPSIHVEDTTSCADGQEEGEFGNLHHEHPIEDAWAEPPNGEEGETVSQEYCGAYGGEGEGEGEGDEEVQGEYLKHNNYEHQETVSTHPAEEDAEGQEAEPEENEYAPPNLQEGAYRYEAGKQDEVGEQGEDNFNSSSASSESHSGSESDEEARFEQAQVTSLEEPGKQEQEGQEGGKETDGSLKQLNEDLNPNHFDDSKSASSPSSTSKKGEKLRLQVGEDGAVVGDSSALSPGRRRGRTTSLAATSSPSSSSSRHKRDDRRKEDRSSDKKKRSEERDRRHDDKDRRRSYSTSSSAPSSSSSSTSSSSRSHHRHHSSSSKERKDRRDKDREKERGDRDREKRRSRAIHYAEEAEKDSRRSNHTSNKDINSDNNNNLKRIRSSDRKERGKSLNIPPPASASSSASPPPAASEAARRKSVLVPQPQPPQQQLHPLQQLQQFHLEDSRGGERKERSVLPQSSSMAHLLRNPNVKHLLPSSFSSSNLRTADGGAGDALITCLSMDVSALRQEHQLRPAPQPPQLPQSEEGRSE